MKTIPQVLAVLIAVTPLAAVAESCNQSQIDFTRVVYPRYAIAGSEYPFPQDTLCQAMLPSEQELEAFRSGKIDLMDDSMKQGDNAADYTLHFYAASGAVLD